MKKKKLLNLEKHGRRRPAAVLNVQCYLLQGLSNSMLLLRGLSMNSMEIIRGENSSCLLSAEP